ncbi:hypothetical protein MCO_00931 [Bartonella sp. DB5-6]|nr:hypothetical protein MCO_00931 [Bartonella sp. DB5-6]
MWMDFINFIVKLLHSILIVITFTISVFLYYESKGYSQKEIQKKLLLLVKLFFILMSITSFITLFIVIFYQFNLFNNVLNFIK